MWTNQEESSTFSLSCDNIINDDSLWSSSDYYLKFLHCNQIEHLQLINLFVNVAPVSLPL